MTTENTYYVAVVFKESEMVPDRNSVSDFRVTIDVFRQWHESRQHHFSQLGASTAWTKSAQGFHTDRFAVYSPYKPVLEMLAEDLICWAYTAGRITGRSGESNFDQAELMSMMQNGSGLLTRESCEPLHVSLDLEAGSWAWACHRKAKRTSTPKVQTLDVWSAKMDGAYSRRDPDEDLAGTNNMISVLGRALAGAGPAFSLWQKTPFPKGSEAFIELSRAIHGNDTVIYGFLSNHQQELLPNQFPHFTGADLLTINLSRFLAIKDLVTNRKETLRRQP